jgi:hypothetical protein
MMSEIRIRPKDFQQRAGGVKTGDPIIFKVPDLSMRNGGEPEKQKMND